MEYVIVLFHGKLAVGWVIAKAKKPVAKTNMTVAITLDSFLAHMIIPPLFIGFYWEHKAELG